MSLFSRAGYGSESEGDEEAATVTLSSDLGRVNKGSTKSAVKLQEIGPRMTMQLVKVEEGLCTGGIIFSEYGKMLILISLHCGLYHVYYRTKHLISVLFQKMWMERKKS